MNTASEVSVQDRVNARRRLQGASRSSSGSSTDRSRLSHHSSAVTTSLSPDWTGQCIELFLAEYAEEPDVLHSTWGHLQYMPDLYRRSSYVHLPEAVKAASFAHMANTSSIQSFNQLARKSYVKALTDLRAAMNDRIRAIEDETLAAMNIIAEYEIIAGERPLSEVFHAHFRGQSAILRMRDDEQNSSRWGKHLFAITNRGLILKDMATYSRPYLGLTSWPPTMYASPLAEASAQLSVRAADIRGRLEQVMKISPVDREEEWRTEIRAAALAASTLHRDIQDCIDLAPENWRPRSLPISFSTPPPVRSSSEETGVDGMEEQMTPYPSRLDIYPTHAVATLWNFVRNARLHLLRGMLDLAEFDVMSPVFVAGENPLPTPEHLNQLTCSTIDDVCASVPFLLGEVDESGNLCASRDRKSRPSDTRNLIWILLKLCYVRDLDPGLRAWICHIFQRIGNGGGYRVALHLSQTHAKPLSSSTLYTGTELYRRAIPPTARSV